MGDGNFHLAIVVDPEDAEEMARMVDLERPDGGACSRPERDVARASTAWALANDGTSPPRRGTSLDAMPAVKRALDPHGILNPDKIFRPGVLI